MEIRPQLNNTAGEIDTRGIQIKGISSYVCICTKVHFLSLMLLLNLHTLYTLVRFDLGEFAEHLICYSFGVLKLKFGRILLKIKSLVITRPGHKSRLKFFREIQE